MLAGLMTVSSVWILDWWRWSHASLINGSTEGTRGISYIHVFTMIGLFVSYYYYSILVALVVTSPHMRT